VLDADLSAAFDKIGHDRLLAAIGSYPGREMIRDWLKAGVFEPGKGFAPTGEGTPQGGVISPLLLNIALHGLEEAAGIRYEPSDPDRVKRGSPSLVRYADDMVAFCHSRQEAEQVKAKLAAWRRPGAFPSTRRRRESFTSTMVSTSWDSPPAGTTAS
jgi:RNA-directed DNA polymerase